MADAAQIQPTDAPPPATMPNQAAIQTPQANPGPTNPAAAMTTPQSNVQGQPNGGHANFNDLTQSIMDMAQSQTAAVSTGIQTLKANTAIDQATSKAMSGISNDTIGALSNIQKAQSLPGGAEGDLATIVGLFNSDYDVAVQKTRMDINQVKSTQITNTASAIKEQNNSLVGIAEKSAAASQVIYNAQVEANKLALEGKQYDLDVYKTKLDAARVRLLQSAEEREKAKFTVGNLTTAQAEAVLPQAQAGKGPFAKYAGLIQDRLVSENTAIAKMGQAQTEYSKGNREEGNAAMVDAVSHMPSDAIGGLIAQAKSTGSPIVNIPTGQKGPDGKPVTLPVPYVLAEQGLIQSKTVETQINSTLAAEQSQKLNIVPNIQNVTNSAAAFASMDPRATQVLTNLGNVLKSFDPKNPMSVMQTGQVIQGYNDQMKQIAKDNAAKFTTPEAKGAIENYGATGKFDAAGGVAVMADSGGIPGLARSSRYSEMWTTYNQTVAAELVKSGIVQGGMPQNSTDALSIMAQAMASNKGKQKIAEIGARVLADPTKSKPLQDAVTAKIQGASIEAVIGNLAGQKGADPMWSYVMNHKQDYEDNGTFNLGKLYDAMEAGTVIGHVNGKPNDLSQIFTRAMRSYGANADNATQADPSYTVQDHAAEAALFGSNPAGHVLADLNGNLYRLSLAARNQMKQRINQDVTGKTQNDAVMRADPLFEQQPGMMMNNPDAIRKHTGVDLNLVPSATGSGLTAAQVKAAFPAGLN